MAFVASHLIDTSAMARMRHPEVAAAIEPLVEAGVVATCPILDFEDLYSARGATEYFLIRQARVDAYEQLPLAEREWERALQVHADLALEGRWREVGLADLLVAAVADRHSLTLVHYDADFDTIAAITGQDARWVVPRGSVN